MKSITVTFEDSEYEKFSKDKYRMKLSWRDYFMYLREEARRKK